MFELFVIISLIIFGFSLYLLVEIRELKKLVDKIDANLAYLEREADKVDEILFADLKRVEAKLQEATEYISALKKEEKKENNIKVDYKKRFI